jgi:hypothetical protein
MENEENYVLTLFIIVLFTRFFLMNKPKSMGCGTFGKTIRDYRSLVQKLEEKDPSLNYK